LPMLREHIAEYAKQGGFDPASITPIPPAPAGAEMAKGANPHAKLPELPATQSGVPSGDAAAAVMAQSPEERAKTIRSMVEGLAARLEQSPEDFEGWMRLARAYKVLNEPEKSIAAAKRAIKLRPGDVEPKLALAEVQMAQTKDGKPSAEMIATMRDILQLDPGNARAMYYVAGAEAAAGNAAKAREMLSKLLEVMPANAPERQRVVQQLGALSKN